MVTEISNLINKIPNYIYNINNNITSRSISDPTLLPPRDSKYSFTVFFDIDDTLITSKMYYIKKQNIVAICFLRKNLIEILKKIKSLNVEIIVWSAAHKIHVDNFLETIDSDKSLIDYAISNGDSWCINNIPNKNLEFCNNRKSSSILFDDNIMASVINGKNTICIPKFELVMYDYDDVLYNIYDIICWSVQTKSEPHNHKYVKCTYSNVNDADIYCLQTVLN